MIPMEATQGQRDWFGSGIPSQHGFHTWIRKPGTYLRNMLCIFSTNHIYSTDSSMVQSSGMTGVFIPSLEGRTQAKGEIQFFRLGNAKRTVYSVTCLQAASVGERSVAYMFVHTSFQQSWLFPCCECFLFVYLTSHNSPCLWVFFY